MASKNKQVNGISKNADDDEDDDDAEVESSDHSVIDKK